ncbi:hypothetical protein FI615_002211 [Enterococcus faecium]|nr:hypothetical protein [Enterococcus faecium]EMF0115792.1 hypothetical protein [Enterococcus hirae]
MGVMDDNTNSLAWVIYGILIAGFIFAVAKIKFPELTQKAFDFLTKNMPV